MSANAPKIPDRPRLPTRGWTACFLLAAPASALSMFLFDKKVSLFELILALFLVYSYALCGLLILRRAVGPGPTALTVWGLGVNLGRLTVWAGFVFLLQPVLPESFPAFIAACGGGFIALLSGEVLGLHQAGLDYYGKHE